MDVRINQSRQNRSAVQIDRSNRSRELAPRLGGTPNPGDAILLNRDGLSHGPAFINGNNVSIE
jgi:hypothetical protein